MNAPAPLDHPLQLASVPVGDDTFVLPGWLPLPGMGVLAVNTFVIRGAQPALIDTSAGPLKADFLDALQRVVDPADLRWIVLTHADPDHIGALREVMDLAPRARVVTTFLGMAKLGLQGLLGPDRAWLVAPGGDLDLGDRVLRVVRPPVFDAPETVSYVDGRTGTWFAADTFGTLLERPVDHTGEIDDDALTAGMLTWASIDAPWLELVDAHAFADRVRAATDLGAARVLGSHLPRAEGDLGRLAATLLRAAGEPAFVGPDQAAIEAAS